MGTLIFSLNFSLNLLKNSKITVPLPWEEAHEAVLGRGRLDVDFETGLFKHTSVCAFHMSFTQLSPKYDST